MSLRVSIRPNDCTQSSLASERVTGLPEHFPSQKKLGCFAYVSFYICFEKRSNFLLKSQQLLNVHVRVCVCFSDRWCVRDRQSEGWKQKQRHQLMKVEQKMSNANHMYLVSNGTNVNFEQSKQAGSSNCSLQPSCGCCSRETNLFRTTITTVVENYSWDLLCKKYLGEEKIEKINCPSPNCLIGTLDQCKDVFKSCILSCRRNDLFAN